MSQTYFAILTAVGEAKDANAKALGIPLQITEMAVGDGNGETPTPDRSRTTLVNEVRRAALNQLSIDPHNANQLIAEQVIPENEGGWWIRELGLFDADGDLIAIANCPPTYKPQLAEGSGRTQVIRMVFIMSSADTVSLKVDPAIVLATRQYADNLIVVHQAAANPHPQYRTKNLVVLNKSVAGGTDVVLTDAEAKADIINLFGALTANINVIVPAVARSWTVKNATTGNFSLTVKTAAGAGLEIRQGQTRVPYCDGVDVRSRITDIGAAIADMAEQFDASAKVATTEFVNRRGIQSRDEFVVSESATLTAAHVGGTVIGNSISAGFTLTLPAASAVPKGARIHFHNHSPGVMTVAKAGTDTIYGNAHSAHTSVFLRLGDSLVLESDGDNAWYAVGGSASTRFVNDFFASLATNGYQRLPSGLILQWGTDTEGVPNPGGRTVSFPIQFPNNVLTFATGLFYPDGTVDNEPGKEWVSSYSTSGFHWINTGDSGSGVTVVLKYLALGH